MNPIIGIDLGTTFSSIARLDDHGQSAIEPVDGERIMASCVFAPAAKEGSLIVGGLAKQSLEIEPESVVRRFKRRMGLDTDDRLMPGLEMTPVSASAAVLRKLVQEAEKKLGKISEVVITVPASFAERQRRATIEAGEQAGLKVKNIINEPTAAVLAYATQQEVNGTILIYDFGGGTFDVTIARVEGQEVECLTSKGDPDLGGIDFDEKIAEIIDKKHEQEHGRTLREALGLNNEDDENRSPEWQSLLLSAEKIKKTLSKMPSAPFRFRDSPDGLVNGEVTRDEFERAISGLIANTEMRVETALDDLEMDPGDIDEVLLVGGSTRMPAVRESLKRMFGRESSEAVNPDEAVALGAAIYAGLRTDKSKLSPLQKNNLSKVSVQDVANHYYGTIAMHYDEDREKEDLGVSIIIPKNEKLPCSKTEKFWTRVPDQQVVRCRVTQSAEEEFDPEFVNVILDEELGPLPPGRPAQQLIEITYSYDLDQTMHVEFRDVNSGLVFKRQLKLSSGIVGTTNVPDFTIE